MLSIHATILSDSIVKILKKQQKNRSKIDIQKKKIKIISTKTFSHSTENKNTL